MKLWKKILLAIGLGIVSGLLIYQWQGVYKATTISFLIQIGKVFINLLKMLVGIIVFSSLVSGISHISDPKTLGRIGIRTLAFYVLSTLCAIGFGLFMAYAIQPGEGLNMTLSPTTTIHHHENLADFIFSVIPSNPFASFAEGNILQIIVFAIFFAIAIIITGERGKPILHLVESIGEIMGNLTHVVMRFAPYGVFALMTTTVAMTGTRAIEKLGWAVLSIFLACLLQVSVIFTLAIHRLAKLTVAPFFRGMKDAIMVAISTSSSAATLPVSLECAREKLGISHDISGFVLSLGSTVNMNGTAIGQAVLSCFIAQAYNIELSFIKILVLFVTTLVSAIGTAGIPGSGLVMLSVVLNSMGLPLDGIALVAGIDRLRDMMGTVVNILGDAVAAVYVSKKEGQIDITKYLMQK
ncbi:MAG: dicarboxylate/amino acid:cation symporter [Chlamydiota bacterium]|nr:dicarboxylate/amino acid:cation symporter [Chlamydiota bacterium]